GNADHDIIEPSVGDKTELLHERCRGVVMQINTLRQRRPVWTMRGWEPGKRPRFHVPAVRVVPDQARFDLFAFDQLTYVSDGQRRGEAGNGLADQQWPPLPIASHENTRRQAAQ